MKTYIQSFLIAIFAMTIFTGATPVSPQPSEDLEWHEYLADAFEESEKTGKPIMANFTGSDWCGWCIKLSSEVFDTPEFKKWADDNVVLLELDFPKRTALAEDLTAQNRELQQFFGVSGFPTIWFFDLDKTDNNFNVTPINKMGYVYGGTDAWTKSADGILSAAE